jgi:hypothetical protein
LEQQFERLVGDAIFGIVQKQSGGFCGKPFAAFGVLRKKFSQVQFLDFLAVRGEGFPCVARCQWLNWHVFATCSVMIR